MCQDQHRTRILCLNIRFNFTIAPPLGFSTKLDGVDGVEGVAGVAGVAKGVAKFLGGVAKFLGGVALGWPLGWQGWMGWPGLQK